MTRRSFAWLLLLQLALVLALPFTALAVSGQEVVPVCCRRGGAHQCAMLSHSGGDGFRAAPCSMWPLRHGTVISRHDVLPVRARGRRHRRKFEATVAAVALRAHERAVYAEAPRGPPCLRA